MSMNHLAQKGYEGIEEAREALNGYKRENQSLKKAVENLKKRNGFLRDEVERMKRECAVLSTSVLRSNERFNGAVEFVAGMIRELEKDI